MARRGRAFVWTLMLLAGVAMIELGVYHFAQIGSCASGGPYEIRNPCPQSLWAWLGVAGLGGLIGLVGLALLATEVSDSASSRLTGLTWSGGWILSGIVALVAVYSPGAGPGTKTGGIIMAACWLGLGVVFFLIARPWRSSAGKAAPIKPAGPPLTGPPPG